MTIDATPGLIGTGKSYNSIRMNKGWEFPLILEVHIWADLILLINDGADQVRTVWDYLKI